MATNAPGPPPQTRPRVPTAHGGPRSRRALVAGSVGNFIEWYEFGVYGYFATIIASQFFTPDGGGEVEGLVKTYASFALAFFFRPVGAALFGRVGDRYGRRPTLILVVSLMTAATTLIGILPTYATIGAAAPWLLTLLRIVQGLSAGGEFGGAVSLMTEFAPPGRRGLYGAWQSLTVALGLLGGAAVAAVAATAVSQEALESWAWRLPFLLTLPMGAGALCLRLRLEETPSFRRVQPRERQPGSVAKPGPGPVAGQQPFTGPDVEGRGGGGPAGGGPDGDGRPVVPVRPRAAESARAIVLGAGRLMGWSAAGYTFLVVLPSYLQSTLDATFQEALIATVLANAGFAAAILPAGLLSDRLGRRTVMLTGAVLVAVLAFPLLGLLQAPGASTAVQGAALVAAGAVVGLMAGPGPAMLAEMFPTSVRCTGLGLAYSLSNAVFSGCAGLIITELIKRTGNVDIPAYYAAFACAVSVPALLTLRGDDHRRPLREQPGAASGDGEGRRA